MARLVSQSVLLLRWLLTITLIAPASIANATGALGPDGLICNPSGQALSANARQQLSALEAVLSTATDDPQTPTAPAHCEDCLPPFVALIADVERDKLIVRTHTAPVLISHMDFTAAPRGPPLGSRAPPLSL